LAIPLLALAVGSLRLRLVGLLWLLLVIVLLWLVVALLVGAWSSVAWAAVLARLLALSLAFVALRRLVRVVSVVESLRDVVAVSIVLLWLLSKLGLLLNLVLRLRRQLLLILRLALLALSTPLALAASRAADLALALVLLLALARLLWRCLPAYK
jgi:hypothetical protein